MTEVLNKIYHYTLEEIMGKRFGDYAKEIIQDRAIPDVRDGLKPVQRRILYAMYRDKNTYDRAHKKSATAVGNVMGHYHPHGDSSIYEAMVRMSQWWKQNECYIDMHGNNGSMDGDGAAAMRYTEARLSKIAGELLKDIDKNTIEWSPNFDDTLYEPTVLPAKYPNLLVNGANGISAGYATNIPPHNLGEVIDATIKRIDSPNCHLDTILDIVKGPDFPTGAIVEGKQGIIDALTTGRGKIIIKSKYDIVKEKGKAQIIISEIPFEVNKKNLVEKMTDIMIDKKIEGISEIRDESDRTDPVRIVIDLKKDANQELIINYLLKNTDLQVAYTYNMVTIINRRPMVVGILPVLDAYIAHQREVITKRTNYDLEHAKARMHIVEGLIKALAILDEVIKTIRASKNKSDAINNLVLEYQFTKEQADAIVTLQLYRLTNTDVIELETEHKNLTLIIKGLEAILSDEEKLKNVMKDELRKIKKEYATPRKTAIHDEITKITIDTTSMITKEDCIVVVTNDGYVKRVSKRSYATSDGDTSLKEGDYVIGLYELNTMDTILLFTDKGNYLYVPIHELPDLKWKDLGKHISNIINISSNENIIKVIPVTNFDNKEYITLFTKNGMVKRTMLEDFKVQRYSKPMVCMKLKENDELITVSNYQGSEVFIVTYKGYGLRYKIDEIPITGIKGSGVKAINLKDDNVVSANIFSNEEYVTIITNKGTGKRIKINEFDVTSRTRKGVLVVRDVKTNPYYILNSFIVNNKHVLTLKLKDGFKTIKLTELPITDRYSTGTQIVKQLVLRVFVNQELTKAEDINDNHTTVEDSVSLDSIDERIMTIDDFLDEIENN